MSIASFGAQNFSAAALNRLSLEDLLKTAENVLGDVGDNCDSRGNFVMNTNVDKVKTALIERINKLTQASENLGRKIVETKAAMKAAASKGKFDIAQKLKEKLFKLNSDLNSTKADVDIVRSYVDFESASRFHRMSCENQTRQ